METGPDGRWSFPNGWLTVWDLADYLAARSYLEPPGDYSARAWREAQIFIGVRAVLADVACIHPEEVVRPARLAADLGLE